MAGLQSRKTYFRNYNCIEIILQFFLKNMFSENEIRAHLLQEFFIFHKIALYICTSSIENSYLFDVTMEIFILRNIKKFCNVLKINCYKY